MEEMTNKEKVIKQYNNDDNFKTRQEFHKKYSTNKYGFSNWEFEQYRLFEGCKILELGCGNGKMWDTKHELLPKDTTLILSDFSQGMVDIVKEKHKNHNNVLTCQIDIQDIPYEDESFDIVIANHMLYHVPDVEKAIAEIYRVLKHNGIFYASTLGMNGFQKWLNKSLKEFNSIMDYFNIEKYKFTLGNGYDMLKNKFENVEMIEYKDSIEIDNTKDLVKWIFSSMALFDEDKEQFNGLEEHFEKYKDKNGKINIPKQIGIFIAKKIK